MVPQAPNPAALDASKLVDLLWREEEEEATFPAIMEVLQSKHGRSAANAIHSMEAISPVWGLWRAQESALSIAALRGWDQTCEVLIDAKADPNRSLEGGHTALAAACSHGNTAAAEVLL